ncbi:P-loop containing nucleoside triphosphate hydrolase protein [Ceraceosorus guamensis]|uniref:P-loop containing nucleoside triphosphate hydrolase protein n=1 Tax=Ceraceosorus guamensis TaxID=1522189 RepID=A0A316VTJ4_9BASI|nr:P-loop containing nucleoside triphosphate hydrolase protein [Ceraceosorus guamensis]PWN40929.1 P-loop containing nucleoside triphosphate hydrolase protein [Ceraceosorus guamensis]
MTTQAAGQVKSNDVALKPDGLEPSQPASELLNQGPKLRPYQEECVIECLQAISEGFKRIGVSSPTGSGKTTIFTSLLARLPQLPAKYGRSANQVLIIVSSIELALQTAEVVGRTYPSLLVEIEQGSKFHATGAADVTVATIQTLNRSEGRLNKFDPRNFKGVIVDEAHHAASPSYRSILHHFNPNVGRPETLSQDDVEEDVKQPVFPMEAALAKHDLPIIGFSATFARHDGVALGSVFERIVFHRDFLEMIEEEWLCPVRFTAVRASIDFSEVRLTGPSGDFSPSSLAAVVDKPVINRLIVRTWLDKAKGRRSTLVFCVNIAHVESLTAEFRQAGIDARWLHGSTPIRERRQLLQDFKDGVYPVLVNCAVLTEGADVPAIDCVLLARPTRSRNLFSQMIGRGMRLSQATGKADCLMLDLVGTLERGVVCSPTLFGLDPDSVNEASVEDLRAVADSREKNGEDSQQDSETEEINETEIPDPSKVTYEEWGPLELQQAMMSRTRGIIERMSPNAWVDCGDDIYVLDLPPKKGYVKVERDEEGKAEGTGGETMQNGNVLCLFLEAYPIRHVQKEWVAHFTARNADADEAAAASGGSPRGKKRFSPFRRPTEILRASELEAAIRGADSYAIKRVGRAAPGTGLLARTSPWRSRPSSEKQRAFVEKRLGLDKTRAALASVQDAEEDSRRSEWNIKNRSPRPGDALPALTKGQASIILTKLQHGAKARWEKQAKKHNKAVREKRKEAERRARETVQVGPLPSS